MYSVPSVTSWWFLSACTVDIGRHKLIKLNEFSIFSKHLDFVKICAYFYRRFTYIASFHQPFMSKYKLFLSCIRSILRCSKHESIFVRWKGDHLPLLVTFWSCTCSFPRTNPEYRSIHRNNIGYQTLYGFSSLPTLK